MFINSKTRNQLASVTTNVLNTTTVCSLVKDGKQIHQAHKQRLHRTDYKSVSDSGCNELRGGLSCSKSYLFNLEKNDVRIYIPSDRYSKDW